MTIRGQAWSGEGDVVRGEVAIDGGDAWRDAELLGAPAPYAWRAWRYARDLEVDVEVVPQPAAGW